MRAANTRKREGRGKAEGLLGSLAARFAGGKVKDEGGGGGSRADGDTASAMADLLKSLEGGLDELEHSLLRRGGDASPSPHKRKRSISGSSSSSGDGDDGGGNSNPSSEGGGSSPGKSPGSRRRARSRWGSVASSLGSISSASVGKVGHGISAAGRGLASVATAAISAQRQEKDLQTSATSE